MDEFVHSNEAVAAILNENFLIMKVNYSEENDNAAFLSQFPKVEAYPHVFVLDQDGSFLHSQGTGELESGRSYDEQVFVDFLNQWKPGDAAAAQ